MKNLLIITALSLTSFSLIGQNCPQNENITRFMARGKAALRTAEKPEDYKLAAAEFMKALEYDDDAKCPDIQYNLALCYEPMGKLDPGYYRQAIAYLKAYLALRPNAENKKEVQEKIYEVEFLLEKAGGVSLNDLIGKWEFYWGDGTTEKYDFYDIEIFKNNNIYYVKYISKQFVDNEFSNGNEKLSFNNFATSEIIYENGIFLFEINNEFHINIQYKGSYEATDLTRKKLNYKLKVENNMLKGESFCTYLNHQEHDKQRGWRTLQKCESDCGTKKVYFVKQR